MIENATLAKDVKLLEIQSVTTLFQEKLKIVQQALGIETIERGDREFEREDAIDELEQKPEIISEETKKIVPAKKLAVEEVLENKYYLTAKSVEMKAMFAESQARFTQLKTKFQHLQQARSHDRT